MQSEHCFGIESKFVVTKNYLYVSQQSKKRNMILNNYLDMIQRTFIAYRQFYEEIQEPFKEKGHEKNIYISEFKEFIRRFSELLKQTSIFQIDYITEAKISSDDFISEPTLEIIGKVQHFEEPQRSFRTLIDRFNICKQMLSEQYNMLKKESRDPYRFFDSKYMQGKVKLIQDKIDETSKIQQSLEKSRHEISTNVFDFERYLVTYRKRLLQNKYYALNKTKDYSKNFRQSIMEILLILGDCSQKKFDSFVDIVRNSKADLSMNLSKGRKKGFEKEDMVDGIIAAVQEYNIALDEIDKMMKCLDDAFKTLFNKVSAIFENKIVLLESLNNLYDLDESPSNEALQTLDLFFNFTQKFCGISDEIYQCTKQLVFLRNNVKKHSDVTLSLLRMKNINQSSVDKKPKVDQLFQQISYEFIADILKEAYKSFKETFSELKGIFNQKYYKKKKYNIENSMELSHVQDTIFVPKKKPCKKEIWLWRDYRDRTNYNYDSAEALIENVKNFLGTIQQIPESPELKKYECVLQGKKDSKGVLKICEKCIQFISFSNNNVDLMIPLSSIESLENKIKVFQKILTIVTNIGDVHFAKIPDIEEAKQFLQNKIDTMGPATLTNKKKSLQLSTEEISVAFTRFNKVNSERPQTQGMEKVDSRFIPGITIDHVYDIIYSDKPFTLKGKPEDSFFAYNMKKLKNYNYTTSPYDSKGPQFYTSQKGVNFSNCPLYSTRIIQFDHPLPPIPFMPKACHNKETSKLYWLSHEKFDYEIVSESSGAPYADTFKCKILHQVQKQADGVRITLFTLLFFIKDTAMQGMLKSKGQKEMNENTIATADEIEKILKMVVNSQAGGSNQIDQQVEQQINNTEVGPRPRSEVDRLKIQNKLLIGGLILVIILNVLLKLLIN